MRVCVCLISKHCYHIYIWYSRAASFNYVWAGQEQRNKEVEFLDAQQLLRYAVAVGAAGCASADVQATAAAARGHAAAAATIAYALNHFICVLHICSPPGTPSGSREFLHTQGHLGA
jgi:hypothetical protein